MAEQHVFEIKVKRAGTVVAELKFRHTQPYFVSTAYIDLARREDAHKGTLVEALEPDIGLGEELELQPGREYWLEVSGAGTYAVPGSSSALSLATAVSAPAPVAVSTKTPDILSCTKIWQATAQMRTIPKDRLDTMLLFPHGTASLKGPEGKRPDKDENGQGIPWLMKSLAAALNTTFEQQQEYHTMGFRVPGTNMMVLDTHAQFWLRASAPDIAIAAEGQALGGLGAAALIEVAVPGVSISEPHQNGKLTLHLKYALDENPARPFIWGAYSNLTHVKFLRADRRPNGVYAYTETVALSIPGAGNARKRASNSEAFKVLVRMISSPAEQLGLHMARPNLPSPVHLDEVLGAGAMSVVYRGQVEGHGTCAIKVFSAHSDAEGSTRRSFQEELAALKAISQQHMTGVRHLPQLLCFTEDAVTSAVLTLATKPIVKQVSAERLDSDVAEGYVSALAAVHSAGKVHGDIEPKHLCIDETGSAAIIDFNSARDLQKGTASPWNTWCERGTLRYAHDDVLNALINYDLPVMVRSAAHDWVALVKSIAAIRFGWAAEIQCLPVNTSPEGRRDSLLAVSAAWQTLLKAGRCMILHKVNEALTCARQEDIPGVRAALPFFCAPSFRTIIMP